MASSSEESRFLDDLKRRRVRITLSDTQISGVVQRVSQKKSVVLEDGEDRFCDDNLTACRTDISSSSSSSSSSSCSQCLKWQAGGGFQASRSFSDMKFLKVMHIQQQKVIGIGAEVFGQIAQERLCWLQVATKKVVYLFDVLLLGGQAFRNGLSMILESPHILKVVHDCRCIARCLRAEFRVHLTNVFDTQVADLMLFYRETGGFLPDRLGSLQELLRLHLKLPASELSPLCSKELQRKECPELWYLRPSPPALMNIMSASVSHLLPLRLVLLDALMSDYTILVDAYMSSYRNQSLHIEQTEGALPAEAEELLCVLQERRSWAARRYSLTDAGLLRRSSFNTHTHI